MFTGETCTWYLWWGGWVAPRNLMGSALQGSDLVSSGGTAPLKALGPCHLGKKLFFTSTCGNALPEPRARGCAAMVIISAGSVQGQREPSDTSVPPSLFHRTFYCKNHKVWLGRCAGNRERSLGIPYAPVPHLLGKNCSGCLVQEP